MNNANLSYLHICNMCGSKKSYVESYKMGDTNFPLSQINKVDGSIYYVDVDEEKGTTVVNDHFIVVKCAVCKNKVAMDRYGKEDPPVETLMDKIVIGICAIFK